MTLESNLLHTTDNEADAWSRTSAIASGATDAPLIEATIGEYLTEVATRAPDALALVSRHQSIRSTWREMWDEAGFVARGLLARGVGPGDRVALWSGNRHEWVITQYATARIGALLVCVNPMYKATELEHVLRDSGARTLIMSPTFRGTDMRSTLAQIRQRCTDLADVVVFDHHWDRLRQDGRSVPDSELLRVAAGLRSDDPINIQYTSGTTGQPKGAVLSHRNILNNAHLVCANIGYSAADRVCVPVPLFHCFGMVLGVLGAHTHGGAIVLPAESFDVAATVEAVVADRCTSLYGVPTMFVEILKHSDMNNPYLSSLRTGLLGGAPCPPDLRRKIRARLHMAELSIVCGMTETSPISSQVLPGDPQPARDTTVGRPTPQVQIKIVDPSSGEPVGFGVTGEQCTRGYSVMLGYWNNDRATRETIDADGWLRTGDLGSLDADGYLTHVGRLKDVILRGGENIYPREIEELLRTHPAVSDAYVIAVPDERLGEQVMAWVSFDDRQEPVDQTVLAEFCSARISRSKVPERWAFVATFPTTASGKVQKFRLREEALKTAGS